MFFIHVVMLMVESTRKGMADAGHHQAGKIIPRHSIINLHRTSICTG
jgi:hypothetical protein